MAWLAQQNKGLAATVNVDPASAVKPRRPTGELSMYADPPEGEVAIEEFERVAIDRLRGVRFAALHAQHVLQEAVETLNSLRRVCFPNFTDVATSAAQC
jgi:hypothetical protein